MKKECTALVKYHPGTVEVARHAATLVAGHEYLSKLDWHCSRCGKKYPRGLLPSQHPRCRENIPRA